MYRRIVPGSVEPLQFLDKHYSARDRRTSTRGQVHVYENSSIIRNWRSSLPTTTDLARLFRGAQIVGGYSESFDKVLLSDLLDVDLISHWGSLVNLCRSFDFENRYRLMFVIGVISFGHGSKDEAEIVKVLIAVSIIDNLKALDLPKWPSYSKFRQDEVPSIASLVELIEPHLMPYAGDERSITEFKLSSKQWRQLQPAELAWNHRQQRDARTLADYLIKQWPCAEPTMDGFITPVLIKIEPALESIRPEWGRMFQNLDLSRNISQVQRALDQHHSALEIGTLGGESREKHFFPARCRGGELPTLTTDLLCKNGMYILRVSLPNSSASRVMRH